MFGDMHLIVEKFESDLKSIQCHMESQDLFDSILQWESVAKVALVIAISVLKKDWSDRVKEKWLFEEDIGS